jgi:RNA polymerase sigma-70 factor, ECF subfamily
MTEDPDRRLLEAAVDGDAGAFDVLAGTERPAIFRHCYRMLGSGVEAEDATQDTLERAWRRRATFEGTGPFAAWVRRIATNVCLDALRSRRSRLDPTGEGAPVTPAQFVGTVDPDATWVEPVSDSSLGDPDDEVVRREDISLAFVAALQRLPPRQRAALLLVDVLGFSHAETGEVLELSPSAVNSLLSRAREIVRKRPTIPRANPSDPRLRDLLDRYVRAWQTADIDAFIALITDDVRLSMPPMSEWFDGRTAVGSFVDEAIFALVRPFGIPLRSGWCNGQPAFAPYLPDAKGDLVVGGLQVLEVDDPGEGGRLSIRAIVSFRDPDLALRCGFPHRIQ